MICLKYLSKDTHFELLVDSDVLEVVLEALKKGDSEQMITPLCAAREQCGKWRGAESCNAIV